MPSDDEDGIFKVETVPPPEGESDVYNAPTRVGALAGSIVEEIVQQARRQAEQSAQSRMASSGSASGAEDEPAVLDPMKLRALEELAARPEIALRPPAVPNDLAPITPRVEPPPPSAPPASHAFTPAPSAPPSPSAAPFPSPPPTALPSPSAGPSAAPPLMHVEPSPQAPLNGMIDAPRAEPLAVPPSLNAERSPASPSPARKSSRLSTLIILALVLLCLAFGVYRLIGAKAAARGSASPHG